MRQHYFFSCQCFNNVESELNPLFLTEKRVFLTCGFNSRFNQNVEVITMTSETEVAIKKLSQTRQQTQIILCLLMGGLWKLSPSANWFQIVKTEILLADMAACIKFELAV